MLEFVCLFGSAIWPALSNKFKTRRVLLLTVLHQQKSFFKLSREKSGIFKFNERKSGIFKFNQREIAGIFEINQRYPGNL